VSFLQIHPQDDLLVALTDHLRGETVQHRGLAFSLLEDVPAKQKVVVRNVARGQAIRMYGIVVAKASREIQQGQRLTTSNAVDATEPVRDTTARIDWQPPDVSRWVERTFDGYVRDDGRVGTRNHWIVVPLVFCENRNLRVMREALVEELGYATGTSYRQYTRQLLKLLADGRSPAELQAAEHVPTSAANDTPRVFPHVDGVKFLAHDGGCGGAYDDARALCGLLAGYINHPNVAGATVLSLGCQKSQIADLQQELHRRNPHFNKPLLIFEQQQMGTEQTLLSTAIRHTLAGLVQANDARRTPVPLASLAVGLECGGSDGFSGISANPAIGHFGDLLTALGGTVVLSEFPELAGCENELAGRCPDPDVARRFLALMHAYQQRLRADGNSFSDNPSPGNVRDGLITDAMKSAGAARKGGSSPVVDVLDYPQAVTRSGLNLLCTPGGDVESTTAMAASGVTAMLFSTGLGTPTGNPVAPVVKISSNSRLARRMPDIIDSDAGGIITGSETVEEVGQRLLEQTIAIASGHCLSRAEQLGQDDFIPWKRSLTF
jgi:altronate hydrolase